MAARGDCRRPDQPEDLAQLEETIDVLSDPVAIANIREADGAIGGIPAP
jgi:hypothetical protein